MCSSWAALEHAWTWAFCLEALEAALARGRPEIFNTRPGGQFTSQAFTGRLEAAGVRISMDGRGRALDNVFVERLWRTVKYEEVYLKELRAVWARRSADWARTSPSTTRSGCTRRWLTGRQRGSIA